VRLAAVFLLSIAIFATTAPPRVGRSVLANLERQIDTKVASIDPSGQGVPLGPTRGVYLEGYGAVFTAEVELLAAAAPNPFSGREQNAADKQRVKAEKRYRIDMLKQKMRETLVAAATPLDSVPLDEKVALAVTIPYFRWESTEGMPRQILMFAPRRVLLQSAKGDAKVLDSALKVQEF
jgi:hypothetical protein